MATDRTGLNTGNMLDMVEHRVNIFRMICRSYVTQVDYLWAEFFTGQWNNYAQYLILDWSNTASGET